jgi:hypothetical protein
MEGKLNTSVAHYYYTKKFEGTPVEKYITGCKDRDGLISIGEGTKTIPSLKIVDGKHIIGETNVIIDEWEAKKGLLFITTIAAAMISYPQLYDILKSFTDENLKNMNVLLQQYDCYMPMTEMYGDVLTDVRNIVIECSKKGLAVY